MVFRELCKKYLCQIALDKNKGNLKFYNNKKLSYEKLHVNPDNTTTKLV